MARLSRLLSAVSLGIAATAAVAAVAVATERNPAHHAPTHRVESADHARVIVKFRERSSVLSATSSSTAQAGAGLQKASLMGARLGLALTDGRTLGERTQVIKGTGLSSAALVTALAGDADVEWAEVDHRRYIQDAPVNDPLYPDGLSNTVAPTGPISGQWYLRSQYSETVQIKNETTGLFVPTVENVISGIDIEPAWALTHGSTSIVVGDVDTGITQHPDLTVGNSKMLTGYDFIVDTDVSNDGDGRDADPSDPGDFVTAAQNSDKNGPFYECNDGDTDNPGQPIAEDSSWHGTQTASILGAATNNGKGMAGTGYDVPVIPARALGRCGGYDSDIIAAAQWSGGIAVSGVPTNAHPARVINMSLGAQGTCTQGYVDALTALRDKHVVVVVAAGNDAGLPVGTPANCKPASTNADQTPLVITVAALRHSGTKVGFSDIGPEVTISAPGGNCLNTLTGDPCLYPIITAINSGATTPVYGGGTYSDGLHNVSLGTSFATPMVAGTVALMLSVDPNLSNAQVISILKTTARAFPTVSDTTPQPPHCTAPNANVKQDECICTTSTCGAGMLDAGAAVTAAKAQANSTGTSAAPNYTWPTAAVSSATATVAAGQSISIDGSASTPGSSGAAVTYSWSIPDGDTNVSLSSTTSAAVSVRGVAAGTGLVQLAVTDPTSGLTTNTVVTVTVTPAPASSGGGGGGAANPLWLLALAIAGLLMRPRSRA